MINDVNNHYKKLNEKKDETPGPGVSLTNWHIAGWGKFPIIDPKVNDISPSFNVKNTTFLKL